MSGIRFTIVLVLSLAGLLGTSGLSLGQKVQPKGPGKRDKEKEKERDVKQPQRGQLPDDPKLLELYTKFVQDAEKVAAEYERQHNTEKARAVYEEILKFVPQYKKAQQKLLDFKEKEAKAEKKTVEVAANQGWQETGIVVVAGKPISFTASGTWSANAKVTHQGTAAGTELPAELQSMPLGALIGTIIPIVKPKEGETAPKTKPPAPAPFLIGAEMQMVPGENGKLMLRMNDVDPADNTGKIRVEVVGTFERR